MDEFSTFPAPRLRFLLFSGLLLPIQLFSLLLQFGGRSGAESSAGLLYLRQRRLNSLFRAGQCVLRILIGYLTQLAGAILRISDNLPGLFLGSVEHLAVRSA